MPRTVTDWKQLEVGKFYKLSCGCAGMVVRLDLEMKDNDDLTTGFVMAYSNGLGCKRPIADSLEQAYRENYGPYTNYFNGYLSESAMPAEEMEKPEWWDELVTKRTTKALAKTVMNAFDKYVDPLDLKWPLHNCTVSPTHIGRNLMVIRLADGRWTASERLNLEGLVGGYNTTALSLLAPLLELGYFEDGNVEAFREWWHEEDFNRGRQTRLEQLKSLARELDYDLKKKKLK